MHRAQGLSGEYSIPSIAPNDIQCSSVTAAVAAVSHIKFDVFVFLFDLFRMFLCLIWNEMFLNDFVAFSQSQWCLFPFEKYANGHMFNIKACKFFEYFFRVEHTFFPLSIC